MRKTYLTPAIYTKVIVPNDGLLQTISNGGYGNNGDAGEVKEEDFESNDASVSLWEKY